MIIHKSLSPVSYKDIDIKVWRTVVLPATLGCCEKWFLTCIDWINKAWEEYIKETDRK